MVNFPGRQGAIDPDGDPLRHEWCLGDPLQLGTCRKDTGSIRIVNTPDDPLAVVTLAGGTTLVNNSHTVCLLATDPWGERASDCAIATVTNRAPRDVNAGGNRTVPHRYLGPGLYEARFTPTGAAGGIDDDGDPLAHRWYLPSLLPSGPTPAPRFPGS
jgi:hypothetical protein